jgi:hypothetical protein
VAEERPQEGTWDESCAIHPGGAAQLLLESIVAAERSGVEALLIDTQGGGSELNNAAIVNSSLVVVPTHHRRRHPALHRDVGLSRRAAIDREPGGEAADRDPARPRARSRRSRKSATGQDRAASIRCPPGALRDTSGRHVGHVSHQQERRKYP